MGKMDLFLNENKQDNLPSTSEVNPRREGIEHCKVITLKSVKELEGLRKGKEKDMEAGQTLRPEITRSQLKKGKDRFLRRLRITHS